MPARQGWTAAQLGDLHGRRFVVTGASNGVGLESARALAEHGADVVLAVRKRALGEQRATEIAGSTQVQVVDLADLNSIRRFAADLGPIDVLINNAGVFPVRHERTVDGFELALGTNALGPFALTALLLPQISDRVVNVASNSHKAARLDRNDMHLRSGWSGARAYANSKLVMLGWTFDLDRRLREASNAVRVIAAEPGWAASNISNKPGMGALHHVALGVAHTVGHDSVRAARSTLFAATEPLPGGSFIGYDGVGGFRGRVTMAGRSAAASDPRLARWVTEFAQQATGVEFARLR